MQKDPIRFAADGRPRARGLGLPFDGTPGAFNAITDVGGVEVGFATLVRGQGKLEVGRGPVRTGVTAILPRGHGSDYLPVWAGIFALNGNGEMTGSHWIEDAGHFYGPICLTNTHSVGAVHHAAVGWMVKHYPAFDGSAWAMPVVAETFDGHLNDVNGRHVTEADALAALDGAATGPLPEGNVGGGTGMIAYEFKGGTGTASRRIKLTQGEFTVGALVQANFGIRPWLTVLGVPVGRHLTEDRIWSRDTGSIIALVGTDAPLLAAQLQRCAKRIGLGVGRTGTPSGNSSGDIFLAFSTANAIKPAKGAMPTLAFLPDDDLDPLYLGLVQAVEEAILNAMIAAETMVGRDGHRVVALDHGALLALMRRYGRLAG
ncbi:MAG: P1 family peptidase [Pseudomonadota bacterium]